MILVPIYCLKVTSVKMLHIERKYWNFWVRWKISYDTLLQYMWQSRVEIKYYSVAYFKTQYL